MSLAAKLSILVETYPEALKSVTANHVITAQRTRLLVDDRLAKTHQEKLDSATLRIHCRNYINRLPTSIAREE